MQGYRIYNTWMGDPSKIILLEEVLRVIHQDKLIEAARDTGHFLLQGLQELQVWYTRLIDNAFTSLPANCLVQGMEGGEGSSIKFRLLVTVWALFLLHTHTHTHTKKRERERRRRKKERPVVVASL